VYKNLPLAVFCFYLHGQFVPILPNVAHEVIKESNVVFFIKHLNKTRVSCRKGDFT
jgi:hypothetical protein